MSVSFDFHKDCDTLDFTGAKIIGVVACVDSVGLCVQVWTLDSCLSKFRFEKKSDNLITQKIYPSDIVLYIPQYRE